MRLTGNAAGTVAGLLGRKLLRDLWHMRSQILAIALVVACGMASYVTSRTAWIALQKTQADYYARYRFADVFAHVRRAPDSVMRQVEVIPGVVAAEARIVVDVALEMPGRSDPATARIVSLPTGAIPKLNRLHLRRGAMPVGARDVVVSEAFAATNGTRPGDTFHVILNGRRQTVSVSGIALSPEYIYEIRPGDLFPDRRRFGVFWMSRDAIATALDLNGAFNDLSLGISPGTPVAPIIAELDRLLKPYGGLGAYGRADHVSHRFITDEIAQNRVSGSIVPTIFLGIGAFLIHMLLSRLVRTQRDQIAVLRAFGYGRATIALHYMQFALAALLVGSVLGVWAGSRLGHALARLYQEYYRFPALEFETGLAVLVPAAAVTTLAALAGSVGSAVAAVRLPPAEAMRPETPADYRAGLLERLGIPVLMPVSWRIALRSLERHPVKALLSATGIGLAVSILLVGHFFRDAIEFLADVQFRHVQREDATVVFSEPRTLRAVHEVERLPGVLRVEPFRSVPVRLSSGHRYRRVALTGLPDDGELRRVVDSGMRSHVVPDHGLLLTAKLAEVLHVRPGDMLRIEVLEGRRQDRVTVVSGVADEVLGISAYMSLNALNSLLREGSMVSGVLITTDPLVEDRLYRRLRNLPGVQGVSSRRTALASFQETLARGFGFSNVILVFFATAIAFATVFNSARIALSERGRELASLRVLGFSRGEVARILLAEQFVIVAVAMPVGLWIGYEICRLLTAIYRWELFRLPLVIERPTYAFALFTILVASAVSSLAVWRRVRQLDLVAVLKTRE